MPLPRALAVALALSALLAAGGCAQFAKPVATTTAAAPDAAIRLEVDAPSELRKLLEQHLDLARLQQLPADEGLDDGEWARLIAAAPAQARELLQTEGYFEPEVTVARERGTPALVRVRVQPGPRSHVERLRLEFAGEFARRLDAGDAAARALQARLQDSAARRAGQAFRNEDWGEAKLQLQSQLRSAGYAAATLAGSHADVDVAGRTARLLVVLDSGPLFTAGPLRIDGLVRHDRETVEHLAGFGAGAVLSDSLLLDYQERLQKSGLFEAVSVTIEPDPAHADGAPVSVRLRELPLQQATTGIGYSANTGPRASLEHTHRRPFGQALTAYNKIEWARDAQTWTGDLYSHPLEGNARRMLGVLIERVNSDTDLVLSQRLRAGRTQDTPRFERLAFGELLRSRQTFDSSGETIDARAASLNLHLVLRQLDSALLPTRGYTLSLQTGAGQASSNSGERGPFARLYGRLTGYWPLGQQWYGQARVEAGQIVKRDAVIVPDALGFRAGGDDSVRGYGYRTLAPVVDGNTVSGNLLLTGSVELARPVSAQMPSVWGAVFVDTGRAADDWNSYNAALGYGVGVRWRSPIGPLRADLAWGQELHKLRLHLSVGIAF